MSGNENKMTKEMIQKAIQCKDASELVVLAKAEGIDLSQEEAEAYLAEMNDLELDSTHLKHVAGGGCYKDCVNTNLSVS